MTIEGGGKGGKLNYVVRLPLTLGEAQTLRDLLDAKLDEYRNKGIASGHDMNERLKHVVNVVQVHRKLHETRWWKKK